MNVAAVATFELNSVQNTSSVAIAAISATSGQVPICPSTVPRNSESPLPWIASASARPPPNSSSTSHGSLRKSTPAISAPPSFERDGITNSASPASSAIVVSLNSARPGSWRSSGPVIQASAVSTNTTDTRRSATVMGPSARRASRIRSLAVACEPSLNGNATFTSTSQATGINSSTVGIPNTSHCAKLMLWP